MRGQPLPQQVWYVRPPKVRKVILDTSLACHYECGYAAPQSPLKAAGHPTPMSNEGIEALAKSGMSFPGKEKAKAVVREMDNQYFLIGWAERKIEKPSPPDWPACKKNRLSISCTTAFAFTLTGKDSPDLARASIPSFPRHSWGGRCYWCGNCGPA